MPHCNPGRTFGPSHACPECDEEGDLPSSPLAQQLGQISIKRSSHMLSCSILLVRVSTCGRPWSTSIGSSRLTCVGCQWPVRACIYPCFSTWAQCTAAVDANSTIIPTKIKRIVQLL